MRRNPIAPPTAAPAIVPVSSEPEDDDDFLGDAAAFGVFDDTPLDVDCDVEREDEVEVEDTKSTTVSTDGET